RNVSGQHKEEIDALGGVGGGPSCRCHQRGNHEGSQSAHYVDTVLHCEQPGRLSPQRRRREPQSLSCPAPPLASGATSGPGRPWIVGAVGLAVPNVFLAGSHAMALIVTISVCLIRDEF